MVSLIFEWDGEGDKPSILDFDLINRPFSNDFNWAFNSIAIDLQSIKDNTVWSIAHNAITLKGDITLIEGDNIDIEASESTNEITISAVTAAQPTTFEWEQKASLTGGWRGITYLGGNLYITGYDGVSNKIQIYDPDTLVKSSEFASGATFPYGLTNDGTYIYECDGNTRNTVRRYTLPGGTPTIFTLGSLTPGDLRGIHYDSILDQFLITDDDGYLSIFSNDFTTLVDQFLLYDAAQPVSIIKNNNKYHVSYALYNNTHYIMSMDTSFLPIAAIQTVGEFLGITVNTNKLYACVQPRANVALLIRAKNEGLL